jgi:carbon monoxide dehydrogenase subunit G
MLIDQRVAIDAGIDNVWEFVMDVEAVGRCMPGVESVTAIDDSHYKGVVNVRLGPIAVRLEGIMQLVEQDAVTRVARMDLNASDRRLGGQVTAKVEMRLEPITAETTALVVHADAVVLGKLGQFGQAVIKHQAQRMFSEFAKNMAAAIAS